MIYIKIILLLSLAAYVVCVGNNSPIEEKDSSVPAVSDNRDRFAPVPEDEEYPDFVSNNQDGSTPDSKDQENCIDILPIDGSIVYVRGRLGKGILRTSEPEGIPNSANFQQQVVGSSSSSGPQIYNQGGGSGQQNNNSGNSELQISEPEINPNSANNQQQGDGSSRLQSASLNTSPNSSVEVTNRGSSETPIYMQLYNQGRGGRQPFFF